MEKRATQAAPRAPLPNAYPTFDLAEMSALLRALNLPEAAIPEVELFELADVLQRDYRTVAGLPSPEIARRMARVASTGLDLHSDAWKKWRKQENFRVRLPGFDSEQIAVNAAPYTRGAGLLLWGFSCDMRAAADGAFVIFLNTAHPPGAVAATVAHEMGHFVHRSIAPEACEEWAPLAANFTAHLDDQRELFSDSVVAMSAYSRRATARAAESRTTDWIDEVLRARELAHPDYRIDFANRMVSPVWRIRYLATTIHFFKLRKALLETAAV